MKLDITFLSSVFSVLDFVELQLLFIVDDCVYLTEELVQLFDLHLPSFFQVLIHQGCLDLIMVIMMLRTMGVMLTMIVFITNKTKTKQKSGITVEG